MLIWQKCCFLCLESVLDIQDGRDGTKAVLPLQVLLCQFQIYGNILTADGLEGPSETTAINVELCKSCKQNYNRLSVLFKRLEKVQLEINYFLEQTHHRISNSEKKALQKYSKMKSDADTLSQVTLEDKLQEEIAKKCSKLQVGPRPQVNLTRAILTNQDFPVIKNEEERFVENNNALEYDAPDEFILSHANFSQHSPSNLLTSICAIEESKFSSSPESLPSQSISEPVPQTVIVKVVKKEISCSVKRRFLKDPLTGKFPCPSCDKTFIHSDSVRIHFQGVHERKKWKCDICRIQVCSHPSSLRRHKKLCRKKPKQVPILVKKESEFKVFTDFESERKEFPQDPDTGRFNCDMCDKTFSTAQTARFHYESAHQGRLWKCNHCNIKSFKYPRGLRKHRKICLAEKA